MGTGRGLVASTSPFCVVSCGRVTPNSWVVKKMSFGFTFQV